MDETAQHTREDISLIVSISKDERKCEVIRHSNHTDPDFQTGDDVEGSFSDFQHSHFESVQNISSTEMDKRFPSLEDHKGISNEGFPWPEDQIFQPPRPVVAMIDLDEWEINPINIFLGKKIGHGHWGNVYSSLVRSAAIRKLRSVILPPLKDEHVFAAVKISKGIFLVILLASVKSDHSFDLRSLS